MRTIILLGSIFASAQSALGGIYDKPSQLPTRIFDYIVVGGGTAGNVIAERLSEDKSVSVLVLEAGGSNAGQVPTMIPAFGPAITPHTSYDWNYTTTIQSGFNNRSIPYPRGFVLGGSSSVNYMVYNRGSRDDFDRYAKVAGSADWSWDSIIKNQSPKNEKIVAPNDGHNFSSQFVPSNHYTSGRLSVSLPGYTWPLDSRAMALTKEFPDLYPYRDDVNGGNPIGMSWAQCSVGDGQRSSSATAYLGPDAISRSNLHVLVNARATKLIQTGTKGGLPFFGSVSFAASAKVNPEFAFATKEIIVSAGAFNTPQLLQLSGIGDKKELSKFGIKSIVDLHDVGKNGSDHVILPNIVYVNANDTLEMHTSADVVNDEIAKWSETHKGPLSDSITNVMGWFRLPQNDAVIKKSGDPSAGPTSAHYEVIFVHAFAAPNVPTPSTGLFNTLFTALISPSSRGTVTLKSTNPFEQPLINPNYLSTDIDIHAMVESVRTAKKMVESNSWKGYFNGYWGDLAKANTEEEITQFVRNTASTVYHYCCTAGMSARNSGYGVVDPDLRVKGTANLRIVDASVLPYIPSAHTQGPIYLVAELAASYIKAQAK